MTTHDDTIDHVIRVIVSTLGLDRGETPLTADTALLDHLPELDSMAIVQLLVELEGEFGFEIDEDDLSSDVFATVDSLARFVERRCASV
jgi:acyl carrier protein